MYLHWSGTQSYLAKYWSITEGKTTQISTLRMVLQMCNHYDYANFTCTFSCSINSRVCLQMQYDIDGLVQECSNSIANALELLRSCAMPSIRIQLGKYRPVNVDTHAPTPPWPTATIYHFFTLAEVCILHAVNEFMNEFELIRIVFEGHRQGHRYRLMAQHCKTAKHTA